MRTEREMADFAAKVSNDISEDIDCRESRKELRDVIRWWADQACHHASYRSLAEGKVVTLGFAVAVLIPFARRSRSKTAKTALKIAKIAAKI